MSRADLTEALPFHGGWIGALAPFILFVGGVAWLGLAGAPDERGFWPVLLAALGLAMALCKDRRRWAETTLLGMSQPIVALMIMAWLLAGVLGTLLNASGFVEALVWCARSVGVAGGGYAATAFLVCCLVSTATGTSLGTIILCGPLLYPAAAGLAVDPVILMGAIIGGATFGDNISPVSDTTIASASTQGADIGGVVRSRLRYALPAATLSLLLYSVLGGTEGGSGAVARLDSSPEGLPMLVAPVLVIALLLRRRHLLEGLLIGIAVAIGIALTLDLIAPGELLYLDLDDYLARGLVLEGMERGIGASIFTLLLMGLLAGLEASGMLARLVEDTSGRARSARGIEAWMFATVSAVALLTTHSVVAILAVGRFARKAGEGAGISPYRRANLLDLTVCTYPFLVPYAIPTILAASTSAAGEAVGLPHVSPMAAGLANLHSWILLAVTIFAIVTGYGRERG